MVQRLALAPSLQRLVLAGICGLYSMVVASEQEEILVTARQFEESPFATPYAVDIIGARRIGEVAFRSTPEIFREVPGSLVQKTAHGQGSPYLRGFTGYRNLFMVDGIRLNNAVFRDGPNQYWNTVDPGSIQRMEIVRGPGSVLYGSDAIGGTINVFSRRPQAYLENESLLADGSYRYSSGDDSHISRVGIDAALGPDSGIFLTGAIKRFGDLEAGNGQTLHNTGYDEYDFQASWEWSASDTLTLQVAHQQVRQDDVPRTHKTVASRAFAGTQSGTEYRRNLDQERRLSYLKVIAAKWGSWQNISMNLYHQRQEESRDRIRSGDRSDQQSLEVDTWGINVLASLDTANSGVFTAGLDWSHDDVGSDSSDNPVQGPVADHSGYDWAGIYLQNRYPINEALDLTTGIRLGYFEADAGRVLDPLNNTAYSYSEDWTDPVANIRLGWTLRQDILLAFAGISQGFRAPNLSDLTRFDSARSREFEVPATDLEPEKYTSYELGAHWQGPALSVEGALFFTDIDNQITRQLTGNTNSDGEYEVTKSNGANGELYGLELKGRWQFLPQWSVFGHYAYLNGNIRLDPAGGGTDSTDKPSRLMPTNYRLGLRHDHISQLPWWVETELIAADEGDRLSERDELDIQRIPPGGTPDYTLWNMRGGWQYGEHLQFVLAVENLLNENYRLHGSGQNEPGRHVIARITLTL